MRIGLGIDTDKLIKFLEDNPDSKLLDMAQEFNVSTVGIFKCLKRLGYGYKKKVLPTWKLRKKKEKNT